MSIRQMRGENAEKIACEFLVSKGLKLVEKNFRVKGGEIDLIMLEKKVLVFVEVRLRSKNNFGGAAASVDFKKQRRIILAAKSYLMKLQNIPECRFDCVVFEGDSAPVWIKGAFDSDGF